MGYMNNNIYAALCDDQLPPTVFGDGHTVRYWADHGGGGPDTWAHLHWSVLTITDGLVTDVDWGYHSEEEATSLAERLATRQAFLGEL